MAKKFEYLVIGGGLVGCLVSLILSKKKHSNKADAILIASFYEYIIKNNK